MPVDPVEDVVDLIYEASARETLWSDVPAAIGRQFGARTTPLYRTRSRPSGACAPPTP